MNKSKRNINKRTKKNKNKRTKKNRNKRTKKNRNKNMIGGIKIYERNGDFTIDPTILREGKDFFRKMAYKREIDLCKLLMKNPHKNIIKIYDIGNDYIDMELLNTNINKEDMSNVKNVMNEVKTHLQNVGIMYIDWKLDNVGIGEDGQFKLFDFDVSGLIDIETNEWIINPPKFWSYWEAIKNGKETPVDIDNYAFEIGFVPNPEEQ